MGNATLSATVFLGLGNPSKDYEKTYHNVGVMCAGSLALQYDPASEFSSPSRKHFEFASVDGITVARPTVFMNESGIAAKELLLYLKRKPENLCVIHDDSDMAAGTFKITFDQRSAGHKGVQSIIDALGTQKFWRIKIGIRPAKERVRQKAEKIVLKKISKTDSEAFAKTFERIAQALHDAHA